ncbi:MAG: TolC family protein [Candidatus Methylacidiphilales bacterium]
MPSHAASWVMLALLALCPRVQSQDQDIYTLADCLNIALKKNPSLELARLSAERAQGSIIEAKAVLYPQLKVGATAGMENNDVLGQKNPSENELREDWRGEVRVTWNIISGGENSGNIGRAKTELSKELLLYEKVLNNLVHEVKTHFYEAMLYSGQVETQRQIIDLLEKEVVRQERLFEAGRSTKFNIVRTQVRLANESPRFLQAEKNLQESAIRLVRAMGLTWDMESGAAPLQLSGELSCPELDLKLTEAVKIALRQRPDTREHDYSIQIAEFEARVARSSNIPKIDLFAQGIARRDDGSGSSFIDYSTEAAFGFLGRWDIFDGFAGKGRAKQADARRQQAEIRRDDAGRLIALEVTQAFTSLAQSRKILDSQAQNVKRAEQSIDMARSSVDAGFGSQFDILQATVDYNQALNIELEAKFNYHRSLADLEKALFTQSNPLTPGDVNYEPTLTGGSSFRSPENFDVRR